MKMVLKLKETMSQNEIKILYIISFFDIFILINIKKWSVKYDCNSDFRVLNICLNKNKFYS